MEPLIIIIILWTLVSFMFIIDTLRQYNEINPFLAFSILLPGSILLYIFIFIEDFVNRIKK